MALRADDLIDRRRLRRKLTFWRVVAIGIVALGVIALSAWFYGDDFGGSTVDHIAKVKIEGTITEDEELIKRLEDIRKSLGRRNRSPILLRRGIGPGPSTGSTS